MPSRRTAFTALALLAAAPAMATQKPSQLIVFGDSLVDAGNLKALVGSDQFTPASKGYFQGRFTNGPDYTDLLNRRFYGSFQSPALAGSGTNYAIGGARAVDTGDFIPDLGAQLGIYLGSHAVDTKALYVINMGGNDVFGLQSGNIGSYTAATYSAAFVERMTSAVQTLSSLGATRILVTGVPNTTPVGFALETQLQAGLDMLEPTLGGTQLIRFSYQNFLGQLAADPVAFGVAPFTEAGACFDHRTPVNGRINCDGFTTVDNTHPIASIQAALYRSVYDAAGFVPEPGTWALMIAGFGLVGTAMRRRARLQAA
ncbi:PEPxxWA-CTERM sorting domain-containing protein [Glacieibacterium sp.]|uniref:PEPxxWA-CTERM sorting domain-containing protein n=1 Tax=Glacieibacterium sp. TaxID=2860237 RepID=UPI003AFFFB68